MSAEFFRFWRYIQRFALGAVLIVEIIVLLSGHTLIDSALKFLSAQKDPLALLNNTLLVAGFIFLSGSIGILITSIISGTCTMLLQFLGNFIPLKSCQDGPGIRNLIFYPAEAITLQMIKDNADEFVEYYELRSIADVNPQKSAKAYHTRLKTHFSGVKNSNRFFMQIYQNTLTQEQRHIDNLKWDILSTSSLLVIIMMALILLLVYGVMQLPWFLFALCLTFLIIIPEILRRKKDYIYYLNASAGSSFQFGPGAEVADRDSI